MATIATTELTGPDAHYSAMYFPWVHAADPQRGRTVRAFPPCGFVAGMLARMDATRAVWKAPVGGEAFLSGATELALRISDEQIAQLNSRGINCLRLLPEIGPVVWGARTLHRQDERDSEWRYISVRRTALYIEETLHRGMQWVVFESNAEPLWADIRQLILSYKACFGWARFTVPRHARRSS